MRASQSGTRSGGRLEMGNARVFLPEDFGDVRGVRESYRVLSYAVGAERLRKRTHEIRDGQRFDPVSAGETATPTVDSQDYGVPGSRECRAGQEMENVMHAYHRAAVVGKNGGVKSPL